MKVIALEEHFITPPKPGAPIKKGPPPIYPGTMVGAPFLDAPDAAEDLDEKRLAAMDANGVTMQVLSLPFAQSFPAETAVTQCREANDYLAQAIRRHPDRFAGFAAIPTAVPEACAAELERCVRELGIEPRDRLILDKIITFCQRIANHLVRINHDYAAFANDALFQFLTTNQRFSSKNR